MRRSAGEIIRNLEMRVARLERQASNLRSAKQDDKAVAKSIATVVSPLFEKTLGVPFFEEPQAEVDERTNNIIVSQRMVFRLSEAQFTSGLPAGQRNIKLPRSKSFKKTLAEAIVEEAWDNRITINSLGQKRTRVNYRELAGEYTFTGEVYSTGDDLVVEEVSLKRGNFSITILYKQYFKPDQARGEDMESYMRDDDMNRYASNLRLDRKDEKYIKSQLGNPPKLLGAEVIRSRTNRHHGLKYELVEVSYPDIFLHGPQRGYVIFEVDGRNRELMEVIESKDRAKDRFDEYTD